MRGLYLFRFSPGYFKENKGNGNIIQGLLLCIICFNFIIIAIPTQDDLFLESADIITQLLKGFGLEKKEKQSYQTIPALLKDHIHDSNSPSFNNRFRLSSHYVPGWADTRWQFRKNITIDNTKITSDLVNYPIYIELYDSDLQQKAQASGNDILFTNASGHLLDHEIEVYDRVYNSSHAHLVAWVKANLSSTQESIISIYYGNPTAINQENPEGVWDDNYEFVLHMNQDPAISKILDSTLNGFDFNVEVSASMTSDDLTSGQTGKALAFDGIDDYIYLPISEGFSGPTDKMTFEFWIMFPNGGPSARDYLAAPATSAGDPYISFFDEFEFHVETSAGSTCGSALQSFTVGTWYSIAGVWDGTGAGLHKVYIDGALNGTDSSPQTGTHVSWNTLSIGTEDNPNDGPGGNAESDRFIYATVSEFRLSNVLRSADWISTEYENQKSASEFYSLSSEEFYNFPSNWDFSSLKYRKEIIIDASKVSGDLTDFPLAIDLFDTDLHDPSRVQADGDDIIFTDSDGNKLDHEIEKFNQNSNTTHAHLVAWVKIPSLSATVDTHIYMYFGNRGLSSQANPAAVWNSNFKGVWHLNQNPAGTPPQIIDSTFYNNDGTTSGLSSGDLTTGKVDGGLNFPATGLPYINMGDQASLNMGSGDFSLELWFRYDSADNNAGPLAGKGAYSSGGKRYFIALTSGSGNIKAEIDDDSTKYDIESTSTYGDDIWHHAVMVRDGNWLRFYIDGAEITGSPLDITGEGSLDNAGMPFTINTLSADYQTPTFTDDATVHLDEVRVSNIAQSANWILTEYTNQFNPNNFYSVNSLELNENTLPYLRYKKDLTIDNSVVSGSNPLYDFPFLIDIYDTDLHMINKVQADGDDIAFTDSNGMRINHEIEDFDQNFNSTHARLIAWVEIPILSKSSNTIIYMWYGNSAVGSLANPDELWGDYGGVWHLHDDFLDSTSNNNDGMNYESTDASAQIADGQDFDGTDDYINVGSGSGMANIFNTGATISTWIYPEGWGGADYGRILDKSTATAGDNGWVMCIDGTGDPFNHLLFYRDFNISRGLWYTPTNSISLNEWQYVVVTYDDSSDSNVPSIYIDGVLQTLTPEPSPSGSAVNDAAQSLYIGDFMGGNRAFDGAIDEVRLSVSIHSGDWINTEFNNQLYPQNYISTGNETKREWADGSFTYSKDIIIDPVKVAEHCLNFPVLFDITDSRLKSGVVQSNGKDIVFCDFLGIKLDHQIESFIQNSSYGHLVAWVEVPHLYAIDYTTITMYYGNNWLNTQEIPEGVWGSNYGGVWHLNEDPNGTAPQFPDSTYNNNDGITGGSAGTLSQTSGQINNSLSFPVVHQDNLVDIGNDGTLQFSSDIWVSAWVKTSDTDPDVDVVLAKWGDAASKQNYFLGKLGASSTFEFIVDSSENVAISMSKINDGTWHYIVGVADSINNQLRLYVDGVLEGTATYDGSSVTDSTPLYLGRNPGAMPDSDQAWGGEIDECRVSNIIHSSNWITTEYNNQYNAASFFYVASEFSLDLNPPIINDFGAEDPGTGTGVFWGDVTDSVSDVKSVTIKINGTEYDMSFNGSHWIYQNSVVFGASYEYQVINASDNRGNYLISPSSIKLKAFTEDTVTPSIDERDYNDAIGPYGTFKANVSDSWGDLDTVIVNVTVLNSVPRNDLWAVMVLTASGYMNDTISMPGGSTFWYVITVNDTAGNSNTTSPIPDIVPDFNSPPEAQNVTLSRDIVLNLLPIYSNCSLYLHYDFYDADMDSEGGTEIRWYKNGLLQSTYNDDKQITNTSALIKGDQWYATVRPKDGQDFGTLETSPTITIQNTPPFIESVTIPASISTDDLIFSNTTSDEDSDPIVSYEIKWYRNSTYLPSYDNLTTITSDNTKKGESWSCDFRVYDGTNHSQWVSSNTIIIGNTPPVASNLGLSPLDPNTSSTLTVSWTFSDADNDIQVAYYIKWYRWETHQPTYDNLINLPSAATAKNQEWYFRLIVYDGESNSTEYSSTKVVILNTPPTASDLTITLNPYTDAPLAADWTFIDDDGDSQPANSWIIKWYKNNVLQSDYSNQTTVPDSATNKGETWNYTLQVYDGSNYSIQYSSSITIIQNSIPTASGLIITSSPTTSNDLVASWTFNDIDGDSENSNWIIHWYKDNTLVSAFDNQTTVSSSGTSKGEVWNYTVQVYDGEDYSIQYNSTTTIIINTPPTASGIIIIPANPYTSDDLEANWTFSDVDGDSQISYYIEWYKGVTHQPAYDNLVILPSTATTKNQVWYFKLTVNDGTDNSSVYSSVSVDILNTPPIASDLTLTSNPLTNVDLQASWTFNDADGDSESTSWIVRWYKNGILQPDQNNSKMISSSLTSKGEIWNYTVRVYDGSEYSIQYNSSETVIQNSIPTASSLTITINPTTSNDLTASWTFNDLDGDSENSNWIIYWYKDNALVAAYDNQTTVPSSETSKGEVWNYTVQVYDGEDYSIQYNSSITIILNSVPTILGQPSFNKTSGVTTDDTLNITYSFTDTDGDSEDIAERIVYWYKDGSYDATKDNDTILDSSETTGGEWYYYIIQVSDGLDYSQNYTSEPVSIGGGQTNDPPIAENLTLTLNPTTSDDLVAYYDYYDNDSDEEAGSQIRWYKDGVLQPDLNNTKIVQASKTTKGEEWYFTVRPKDGLEFGTLVQSSNITILNTPPSASGLTITSNPTTTDNLVADWSFSDIDGDLENTSWIIHWYKDNTLISTYDNQTSVSSSATSKGEVWNYTVQVFDGENYSIQYNSSITTVLNTIPTASGLDLTNNPLTTDSLTVSYAYADADNDVESPAWEIRWYKDNVLQPRLNDTKTVTPGNTSKNEFWHYTLRVHDGEAYSILYTSPSRKILNTAPTASGLTLTSNPVTSDDLQASWTFSDVDGDSQSTSWIIRWYKNGILQPDQNDSQTIPSSLTSKGEIWNYTVKVYDGSDYSIQYNSSTVMILNSPPTASGLTITSTPTTNDDLSVSWIFNDLDGDIENTNWIIHWYKDNTLVSSFDNQTTILSAATSKGEEWNYTLQVYDGEDYSIQYNSSITVIINSVPTISGQPSFNKTSSVTDDDSVEIIFIFNDADGDSEDINERIVYWFKNSAYQPSKLNHSILSYQDTTEGDMWYYVVKVFDGTDYSINYTSNSISIGTSTNDPPIVENLTITINPTTIDNLVANYDYYDNQSHPEAGSLIRWYKDNQLQPHLNDTKLVPSSETKKGEVWYYTIKPMDGRDYGILVTSTSTTILNTAPTASSYTLTLNPSTTTDLMANWIYYDSDGDTESTNWIIYWYKDGVLQSDQNDSKTIDSSYTSKGEIWNYTLQVFDGENYSIQYSSPSVLIINSIPSVTSYSYDYDTTNSNINPDYRTNLDDLVFFVEDEDLSITYIFEDADQPIDTDLSLIQWYYQLDSGSWVEIDKYQNLTSVPSSETSPGDLWKCTVTVFDGTDIGAIITFPEIKIESRPIIQSCIIIPLITNSEGEYYDEGLFEIQIVTTNLIAITSVECSINDSLDQIYYARRQENQSIWILEYQLPPNDFRNTYLDEILLVKIISSSLVEYSLMEFEIYSILQVNFTVEDLVPPRVLGKPNYELDDELNPTSITFNVNIVDYGSEIANVKLFYQFREVNDQGGNGASLVQDWRTIEMLNIEESSGIYRYSITVPFDHNKTSRDIIYYIQTTDANGNTGTVYDITTDSERVKETRFNFSPPGIDPTFVMIIIAITVIAAIFGSFVYVKFIRKPEIVGLDKELVLETLSEITDTQMMDSLDSHTIGTVISFFDQRHGPIPIIILPEILRDNFAKLVELSDRSFSGTGFCDDFNAEITSIYDFVLSQGVRTKVMSFGFALERPEARGGQENLTANIMIHHELFPLVNQFLYDIQQKVHSIHVLMNNNDSEKETIRRMVFNLRKYISNIILAYEKIYGDAELFSEENVQ